MPSDTPGSEASRPSGSDGVVEELRIDGAASSIGAVAVADDGTIAIGLPVEPALAIADASGGPPRRIGAPGHAVMDLGGVGGVGWLADTLWAFDRQHRRLAFLVPGEDVARFVEMPMEIGPAPGEGGGMPMFRRWGIVAVGPDRSLVATLDVVLRDAEDNERVPPIYRDNQVVARVGVDGRVERILALLPKTEGMLSLPSGMVPLPVRAPPLLGVSPTGTAVTVVQPYLDGERTGAYLATGISALGDTTFSRVHAFDAVPIPVAVADSMIAALAERLGQIDPEVGAAYAAAATVPSLYPPFERVVVGHDGATWIQELEREDRVRYVVLGPEGEQLGTVDLPPGSRVVVARGAVIWVAERHPGTDVQDLVRYRVAWR